MASKSAKMVVFESPKCLKVISRKIYVEGKL